MNAATSRATVRIVLTAPADAVRLLREASELARAHHAELAGVFVEESDLLRLAEIPITREVGFTSGTVREIDLASTVRQLQRQAAEVRRLLAQAAAGLDVPWSFRVARGSVLQVAEEALEATDVVLLSPPGSALARTLGPRPAGPTVGVLYDGSAAADRALAHAFELVRRRADALSLVIPDGADPLPLRRRVATHLGSTTLPDAVPISAMRHSGQRALVVALDCLPVRGMGDLRRLVATAECPLVLVG